MALGKGAGSAHLLALHPRRQLLLPALALLACLLRGQRGIDGGQGAVGLGARHGVLVGGAVGRAHWSGRECAMVAQDAMVASPVGGVVAVLGADAGQKGCPLGGRLAGGLCGSARASDAEAGDSLVVVVGAGRAGRERRTVVATGVGIVEGFVRGGGVALSQTARLGGRVVVRCRRRERRSGRHGFGGERSIGQETGVFTEALGGERGLSLVVVQPAVKMADNGHPRWDVKQRDDVCSGFPAIQSTSRGASRLGSRAVVWKGGEIKPESQS